MTKQYRSSILPRFTPLLPPLTILLVSLWTSYIFQSQGEADAHAPLFFGLGLAIIWRLRKPRLFNRLTRWIYLIALSVFIAERSLPHSVWVKQEWVEAEYTKSLLICSISLYLIGILTWLIDRGQHAQHSLFDTSHKSNIAVESISTSPEDSSSEQ